jgi:SAM-dependent methyltransferase
MVAEHTTDAAVLRSQYGDDQRLSARQRLWGGGPPFIDRVLALMPLTGTETVLDVGCGNGRYLAELRERGHTGTLAGLDHSPGMAAISRAYAPTAVADAQALPVPDGSVDVVLCLHMLYHVPDLPRAVGELRRVLRTGGYAVVATNGPRHTAEPRAILARALREVAGTATELDLSGRRFPPELGESLMRPVFDQVETHQVGAAVTVPSAEIVGDYLASVPPESTGLTEGPQWTAVLARARELVAQEMAATGTFRVTSDAVVLIGRVTP